MFDLRSVKGCIKLYIVPIPTLKVLPVYSEDVRIMQSHQATFSLSNNTGGEAEQW